MAVGEVQEARENYILRIVQPEQQAAVPARMEKTAESLSRGPTALFLHRNALIHLGLS